ncbi:hypothetical protein V5N11_008757 [Cardamine amara subsp. amara]|uniref:Uncharacterized protein n=1 Tax=Cardamine amara subsp. amara TaxID=228776 RepID=A0ABD1BI44_CARAN
MNVKSGNASVFFLGSTHGPETDITMLCSEEKELYGNGSFMASSSITTSLSDDKNTAYSNEKEMTEVLRRRSREGEKEENKDKKMNEETKMQKQIAEMYMRSMQQFAVSLAKMKLPMDLHNKPHEEYHNNDSTQIQNRNNNAHSDNNNDGMEKKKEGLVSLL